MTCEPSLPLPPFLPFRKRRDGHAERPWRPPAATGVSLRHQRVHPAGWAENCRMRNSVLNLTPTMPSCCSIAGVIFIPPSWMVAHSMQHDEANMRYGTAKAYVNACVMIFKSDDYKDANI